MAEEKWQNVTALYDAVTKEINYNGQVFYHELDCEVVVRPGSGAFFFYLIGALTCVAFAGMMSGLSVGLMGFDPKNLSIVMQRSKDKKQRADAARVYMLVKDHHFLLVTLLLWNAAAFETLPIFLDHLVPSYAAIIISVTFILVFGEVVPQAVCTGPKRLSIGAKSYYLVRVLQITVFPVAWAAGKLLDCVLGVEHDPDDSVFVYLPESALGLGNVKKGSNRLALVEVLGMSEELPSHDGKGRSRHPYVHSPGSASDSGSSTDSESEESGSTAGVKASDTAGSKWSRLKSAVASSAHHLTHAVKSDGHLKKNKSHHKLTSSSSAGHLKHGHASEGKLHHGHASEGKLTPSHGSESKLHRQHSEGLKLGPVSLNDIRNIQPVSDSSSSTDDDDHRPLFDV